MFNNLKALKTMIVNFICRASKAGKDGKSPLELSIIINGNRKETFNLLVQPFFTLCLVASHLAASIR